MKKLMMMAIWLMVAVGGNAQVEEGEWSIIPKVGVGISDLTGKLYDPTQAESTKDVTLHPITSVVAGVEMQYGLTDQLGLSVAGLFSTQGAKTDDELFKIRMDYFNVPIMLQYYPIPNCGLAIKAGAQIGFVARKKVTIDGNTYDADYIRVYDRYWRRPFYVESELSKQFNKVDVSIPLGISYELYNFVIDVRYNLGLTNIMKDDAENSKNSVWQFTLGYKINLGD